jgi:hypothetical protein
VGPDAVGGFAAGSFVAATLIISPAYPIVPDDVFMGLLINEDFRSRSRHAKKITTGIYLIFRGLFFEHNAEIGRKDH